MNRSKFFLAAGVAALGLAFAGPASADDATARNDAGDTAVAPVGDGGAAGHSADGQGTAMRAFIDPDTGQLRTMRPEDAMATTPSRRRRAAAELTVAESPVVGGGLTVDISGLGGFGMQVDGNSTGPATADCEPVAGE